MDGISSYKAFTPVMSGVCGVTCQRHQTQRAQICLSLENAGKTSLMATGVYQAPSLGSASKSNFSLLSQTRYIYNVTI